MSHGRLEIEVLWSAARVNGLATAIKRPETAQGHLKNCKLLYSRGNPLHSLRVNPTPTRRAALSSTPTAPTITLATPKTLYYKGSTNR